MKFVRVAISPKDGSVLGVVEQAVPFDTGGQVLIDGVPVEMVDAGMVHTDEGHTWTDLEGKPANPARHMHVRLERSGLGRAELAAGGATAEHLGVSRLHATPCTLAGLRHHARQNGPQALPLAVRAWLWATLPDDHISALGLAAVPASAVKIMERIRNRSDPRAGSLIAHHETVTQNRANSHAHRRLKKREAKRAS